MLVEIRQPQAAADKELTVAARVFDSSGLQTPSGRGVQSSIARIRVISEPNSKTQKREQSNG